MITPVHEFEGTVTVGVSAQGHDGPSVSAAGTAGTTLIVDPVAKQPVVSASATEIPEDGVRALRITVVTASELFARGQDSVSVTVTLSDGATLHGNGVTAQGGVVFTLTAQSFADLSGLTITPVPDFLRDALPILSAQGHDGPSVSAAGTAGTTLIVDPVAKQPVVSASATEIPEDGV